jgi:hypothetical protein
MFRMFGRLLLVASVTWLIPEARAADMESALRCAENDNESQRLACYDQIFRLPARTEQARSSPIVPATGGAAAAPGEHEFRDFGLSEAEKRRNADLPTALDSISVTIQSVSRRQTGEQVFKTKEGQVWVEVEPSPRVRVEHGEIVTIRRGALNSYMLVTSRRAGTKVLRVN